MRIGIIGAGQLGRMMALAGIPLGLEFAMYDRSRDVPGAAVADIVTGRFDDTRKLARFARGVDVVTFDWENVPVASARAIARIRPVWPPPRALEVAQDRLSEKRIFERLAIPVAPYAAVDTIADLERADRGARRARHPEDAPPRLRRQGPGPHPPRPRRRGRVRAPRRAAAHLRAPGAVLPRSLAHRRARPCRRRSELPARRERARRRHPRGDARTVAGRAAAAPRRAQSPAPAAMRSATSACSASSTSSSAGGWSRTRWRRACTTPATGPSRARRPASSRTTCAPSRGCRSAAPRRAATPPWSTSSAASRGHASSSPGPGLHWHDYGKAERPGRKLGHVTFVTRRTDPAGPGREAAATPIDSPALTATCAVLACRTTCTWNISS